MLIAALAALRSNYSTVNRPLANMHNEMSKCHSTPSGPWNHRRKSSTRSPNCRSHHEHHPAEQRQLIMYGPQPGSFTIQTDAVIGAPLPLGKPAGSPSFAGGSCCFTPS
ncbi:hypothetical protein M8818_006658 [Zalaria obscura]|uniref:Uncharacterized protein n=1 Tax=Zalaria obscura TaxID=2024903 RepID=A0ACC3S4K2_9PEZI